LPDRRALQGIDKKLYSHKHHSAGFSYKVGLDLFKSRIVWISGPYKAGIPDINIFQKPNGLKSRIPNGKLAIGDQGYRGDEKVLVPSGYDSIGVKKFKTRARDRHEYFNHILKSLSVLRGRFHHNGNELKETMKKHRSVFQAVAILVQYSLEDDRRLHNI
jgi:DDE superfamily endonuclease